MWQTILKSAFWPNSEIEWVNLLTKDSKDIADYITQAKMLIGSSSQQGLQGFKATLRNEKASNYVASLVDTLLSQKPELEEDEDAEEEMVELMIDNFRRIQETFSEEIRGYKGGGRKGSEILLDDFEEVATILESEGEVDWEKLEEKTVAAFPSSRQRNINDFKRKLGDKVNRIIAQNLPDDLPKLNSMYGKMKETQPSVSYEVLDITPQKALTFLELVQEPKKLAGESLTSVRSGPIAQYYEGEQTEMARVRREKRSPKALTSKIKIPELRPLQVKKSSREYFTPTFKGLLIYDLNDEELGLSDSLAADLESRVINAPAIVSRIVDMLWSIKIGDIDEQRANRLIGFTLPNANDVSAETFERNQEEDYKQLASTFVSNNPELLRTASSSMKAQVSKVRKGVSKVFRDFIIDILKNKNKYGDIITSLFGEKGYDELRSNAPDDAGFELKGTMLSANKESVPIYGLPKQNKLYSDKVGKIYSYVTTERELSEYEKEDKEEEEIDEMEEAIEDLRDKWVDFEEKPENRPYKTLKLFGDIMEGQSDFKFADPFRNAISEFFEQVQNGQSKLSDLTGKFTPSLAKNIDIIELIREIRFIDIKLFGNSKINNLLQDDSSLASSLEKELDESDFKKIVNNFYQVFDAIVTKIRKKVVDLVDEHLNVMVNNQAEYLTYNNQIFNFLVINRLIRRSQDGQ